MQFDPAGKWKRVFGAKMWRQENYALSMFGHDLKASLFLAIRLLRPRVRSWGRRFICSCVLLVTRDGPPEFLVLWQLAHLGAVLHAGFVHAVAVAQRRCAAPQLRWELVGQSGGRSRYQQNCCENRVPESIGISFHSPILKPVSGKSDSAKGGKSLGI
jgi:hypothetical protein